MSHTKIVATIGPATCDRELLLRLADAGMSVARLNSAHSDQGWHRDAIRLIRSALPNLPILMDLPGRKIRTSDLQSAVSFEVGDEVVLTTDANGGGGSSVAVDYADLHSAVSSGDVILADDGTLRFTVEAVRGREIVCRAAGRGTLRSRKGINVPFTKLNLPLITDRNRQWVTLAKELGVDFIGVSFIESAHDVAAIAKLVGGKAPRILAKIENQAGVDHLDEIAESADAIMIDRGDLSAETSLETLVIYQKKIIEAARAKGKPVVVATEMLHSMTENDFPTKAEVADITNAVLDGCSATMLSAETAIGRFPLAAVQTMRRIADTAVGHLQAGLNHERRARDPTPAHVIEDAIAMILRSFPITKVVALTFSGYAARMLSARSVAQPIFAVTGDAGLARALNLCAGVEGVHFEGPYPRGSADHIKSSIRYLFEIGKLIRDDLILVTAAIYPRSGTRMNSIQIHRLSDLIEEFGWSAPGAH